ncbi:MAG: hypothetical protein KC486_05770 [Myxococcales bacterium]|nr:hypothetical protein [Myxococcales bacterium]
MALGAGAADEIVVGFGPELGLAAFRSAPATLSMRVVAADGALVGDLMTATIVDEGRPRWVFWLDPGFVVLVMDWDWRGARVAWSALLVRPGQPPTPAVDLGLDGMDVRVARALDRRSVGLIVQAAAISRADEPGRWQTIAVAEDGSIRSTAIAVDLDDLVTRTDERWAPAELDGARGWVAVREGEEPTEGVFAGRRVATDAAAARTDADAVVASIINGAVPPPRGPGGTIFEARGEPLLVRSRGADEVGEPLLMAWRGDVVGAVAMNVSTALFWSGSRFLYAYDGPKGAMILPIDCRRPPLR